MPLKIWQVQCIETSFPYCQTLLQRLHSRHKQQTCIVLTCTHDAFIWAISDVYYWALWGNSRLLGDSGDPFPCLLDYSSCLTTDRRRGEFIRIVHQRSRCMEERAIDVWKMKFYMPPEVNRRTEKNGREDWFNNRALLQVRGRINHALPLSLQLCSHPLGKTRKSCHFWQRSMPFTTAYTKSSQSFSYIWSAVMR